MDIKLTPHKKSEKGFLCMPLVKHLPTDVQRNHPDWKVVQCPVCGTHCYESADMRKSLKDDPGMMPLCTMCSLRWGDIYD